MSQWLVNALIAAELPVICVETRHMKALLTAQQINKTDRNDARGIAQMMRVGLFKPVHVKTLAAQEQRMLLTSRKLLQRKPTAANHSAPRRSISWIVPPARASAERMSTAEETV